jgi:hypothetical protein
VTALALLVAVGVVVAIFLGVGSSSPPSKANAPTSSSITTVTRRDLVETDTESGTLSYANSHTVYNRLSGTITWLPSVGQVIKPGQALFGVAGHPVVLMNGSTPAYRDLGPSDSDGLDILALNRNLVALGFNPSGIVVDDAWQVATTDGVDTLQTSLGETETGTLKLGSVVYLPGDQIVSTVSAQLGSRAALRDAAPAPEFVSLTKTGTTPHSQTTPHSETTPHSGTTLQSTTPSRTPKPKSHSKTATTLAVLLALLKAETAQLHAVEAQLRATQSNAKNPGSGSPNKNGGSSSSSNNNSNNSNPNSNNNHNSPGNPSSGNGGGGPATAVLTTSSARLVATVQLDPSKQSEAKVGERVTVEMPSGHTLNGRVSAVSPVAQPSSNNGNNGNGNNTANNGSGSSTTILATIRLSGHPSAAGLDQASVSVNFAQAKANHVLSVPVTALLATQGGGYAVQEVASPHHLIPVTPGLFAAGYVRISGPGMYPGLEVTDSQG